ncbi:MAG TPA: hypothetical protein VL856_14170 [Acidimicrobiia bacterium]|nr:hypothetical protein [Acidimicrobiia bacterium]
MALQPHAVVDRRDHDATEHRVHGLAPATEELDLDTYYLFHATRGELLGRLERYEDAARAYEHALELTSNTAERALLERKRGSLPR